MTIEGKPEPRIIRRLIEMAKTYPAEDDIGLAVREALCELRWHNTVLRLLDDLLCRVGNPGDDGMNLHEALCIVQSTLCGTADRYHVIARVLGFEKQESQP